MFFSGDKAKLEEMEETVAKEIDEQLKKNAQDLDKKSRSQRHRKKVSSDTAASNELSAAFGERVRAPSSQTAKVNELRQAGKNAQKAAVAARNDIDISVTQNAKRTLFSQDEGLSSVLDNGDNSSDEGDCVVSLTNEDNEAASDEVDEEDGMAYNGAEALKDNMQDVDGNYCHKCAPLHAAGKACS